MATINYRDPRFQEAVLAAHGRPTTNIPGAMQGITSAFVNQQQGVLNKFAALAGRQKRFDSNLQLAREKMAFDHKMHRQSLKDARDASRWGIIGGLGTSVVAGLIGMDRRAKTSAMAAAQLEQQKAMAASDASHQATLDKILEQMKRRNQ